MQKAVIIIVLVSIFCVTLALTIHSEGESQRPSPEQLASEISGAIVYSHYRYIYKVVIGDWKPIALGEGEYARWSPDGKQIAVYDRRRIFVMNSDGSGRRMLTDEGWSQNGCPIEFHTNGHEVIFVRRNKPGLWTVDTSAGEIRKLADFHNYTGEPGISADGKRMACRVSSGAYAVDLVNKTDFRYAPAPLACSSGISPDGNWLMNNRMGNIAMDIRSWDGKEHKVLPASICQPDEEWDNHHWSNHNDYICTQGGKRGDTYVIKVSEKRCTRVTWSGRNVYPDLYVANTEPAESEGVSDGTSVEQLPHSDLAASVAAVADTSSTPDVVLINRDYSRSASRVLIRRIERPTRANLDYAAYDSNVMHYNPASLKPKPPPPQTLADLHFNETLVPESLRDRLNETPLTPAEKVAPMAWTPLTEYLMDWDFDMGYALAKAGWEVSEHDWNDSKVPIPYQEISRVYLHKNPDDTHSLWVRIEFKPWVSFLSDIDDEDSDGFPEIYGMVDGRFLNEKAAQRLLDDYAQRPLTAEEITDWGFKLGADWYDRYYTIALKPEEVENWPNDETEPQVKDKLNGLVLKYPDVVICGKPFGQTIYNVFLIRRRED